MIIVIVVVVVLLLVIAGAVAAKAIQSRKKSRELQEAYGPEYDRAVEERGGDRKEAEKALEQRRERRQELDVRPLSAESRDRYARSWLDVQRRFVDEPEVATGEADDLVKQVMHERGYPVDDFESRSDDLSVDHPGLVENYRSAHAISERNRDGQASTEELRQATMHYRSLFDELLEGGDGDDRGRDGEGRGRGGGDRARGGEDRDRGGDDRGRGGDDRGRGEDDRGRGEDERGRGEDERGGGRGRANEDDRGRPHDRA